MAMGELALALVDEHSSKQDVERHLGQPSRTVTPFESRTALETLGPGSDKIPAETELWVYDLGRRLELPENVEWSYSLIVAFGKDGLVTAKAIVPR